MISLNDWASCNRKVLINIKPYLYSYRIPFSFLANDTQNLKKKKESKEANLIFITHNNSS